MLAARTAAAPSPRTRTPPTSTYVGHGDFGPRTRSLKDIPHYLTEPLSATLMHVCVCNVAAHS
jgi:hypothetical protein